MFNSELRIRVWMFLSYSMHETNSILQTSNKLKYPSVMASFFNNFVGMMWIFFYSLFFHVVIIKGHVGSMHKFVCN